MVASIAIPKNTAMAGSDSAIATGQRTQQTLLSSSASPPKGESSAASQKAVGCSSLPSSYPRSNQASSSLLNYQNLNVYVVGNVGHAKAQIVRVVHISDTRGVGDYYSNGLPSGHILIHSGDFLDGPPVRRKSPVRRTRLKKPCTTETSPSGSASPSPPEEAAWKAKIRSINEFFQRQPHPYKIFVPGCWDYFGPERPSAAEIQEHLTSAIYLEDAACQILGLKVYGVPWTSADDLRPEDGKSHFTAASTTAAAAGVMARLPRWLIPPFAAASQRRKKQQQQHQSLRGRCMSSSYGDTAAERVWPVRQSPDTTSESNSGEPGAASPALTSSSSSTSSSCLCDGFILPDIQAVGERYERVPTDTNILISHMPAWRPELYSHVVERIQ